LASPRGESESWSTRARRPPPDDAASPRSVDPTDPLFDRVDEAVAAPDRTGASPVPPDPEESAGLENEPIYAPPRRRVPPPARQRARRVRQVRRVRRTLRHIDPLSVLKVSLMFYGVFLLLWLLFVAIIYWLLQGAEFFETIEKTLRSLTLVQGSWGISLAFVEKWAFFIGLTVGVVMSLVNLFLAFLYNVVADVIGGIDMTFVERDDRLP
jgi:hypothetical protein